MSNVVVIGMQWGDEGKGKIVDWLSEKANLVVRFQGTNASEGRDVINNSDLGLISIDDFTEAAKKVVDLAKG